jgi:hypothetical protein
MSGSSGNMSLRASPSIVLERHGSVSEGFARSDKDDYNDHYDHNRDLRLRGPDERSYLERRASESEVQRGY